MSEGSDLLVYGATGGGVACAVRAAREGLRVLLVHPYQHLGGMISGGISVADTLHQGWRCPLWNEFEQRVLDHYA